MSDSTRNIVFSTRQSIKLHDYPSPDIDRDPVFMRIFEQVRHYSMTAKETMFSLYHAIRYVVENQIPGDFVECGVWRGGSALTAALTFRELGDHSRHLHLYDTFEGMTVPTGRDVDSDGGKAADYIELYSDDGKWCYVEMSDVQDVFRQHGFRTDQVTFIKGDVVETLTRDRPKNISVLRLDTDWYESTKVEMEQLYPLLSKGGVLIVDDYGHWQGSREAVDEYFVSHPAPLLHRITLGVRSAIKI